MLNRLLIIHGGGPTCVLNASTYGVIREAQKHPEKIGGVFGCMGGVGGLLNRNFRRLDSLAQEKLERLKYTPGTVIGSSRYPLAADDYARLADVLREEGFGYVLMSGGNGTNPIQMMQALSAQVIRHKRVLSDRCVFIVSSVCDGYFHDERWPYLRELYELFQHDYMNVLPDMNRYGEYFATNGEYIRKYRFANAFHPFHGFSMMSCGHLAEMHTSAIYIVGAREPGLARGMGLKTRATFEEALEDARKKFVGEAPSILALPQTFTTAAVHLCMRDPMQNSRSRDGVLHPCGA